MWIFLSKIKPGEIIEVITTWIQETMRIANYTCGPVG
jgi:TusA-related sulfurtransferase